MPEHRGVLRTRREDRDFKFYKHVGPTDQVNLTDTGMRRLRTGWLS